jgi:hypothetical protein
MVLYNLITLSLSINSSRHPIRTQNTLPTGVDSLSRSFQSVVRKKEKKAKSFLEIFFGRGHTIFLLDGIIDMSTRGTNVESRRCWAFLSIPFRWLHLFFFAQSAQQPLDDAVWLMKNSLRRLVCNQESTKKEDFCIKIMEFVVKKNSSSF